MMLSPIKISSQLKWKIPFYFKALPQIEILFGGLISPVTKS